MGVRQTPFCFLAEREWLIIGDQPQADRRKQSMRTNRNYRSDQLRPEQTAARPPRKGLDAQVSVFSGEGALAAEVVQDSFCLVTGHHRR